MKSIPKHLVAGLALLISATEFSSAAVVTPGVLQNTATNNALTGTATQSTTGYGAPASNAIDGNLNGDFGAGSTTHTDDGVAGVQHWQVDLGADRKVDQVFISNRDACCPDRLSNYRVSVYNAANVEIAGQNFLSQPAGGTQPVTFGGITGRTVRVQQLGLNNGGNNVLSLAEVQVLDYGTHYLNVGAGKPSIQSTTDFGGVAGRANDGDTSGTYASESISHTAAVAGSVFWEVDLLGDFGINEIAIHPRTDCCPERNGNFHLSIFDNGSEIWGMDVAPGASGSGLNIGSLFNVWENTGGFIGRGDKVRISLIDGRNNALPNLNDEYFLMLADVGIYGVAVPEPGAAGLAFLAGLGLLRRRR